MPSNENTVTQDLLSSSDMSEERRQRLRDVEVRMTVWSTFNVMQSMCVPFRFKY